MSYLVGNPEDRFSHNETQIAVKKVGLQYTIKKVTDYLLFAPKFLLACSRAGCGFVSDIRKSKDRFAHWEAHVL